MSHDFNNNIINKTQILKSFDERATLSVKLNTANQFIGTDVIKGARPLVASATSFYKEKIKNANFSNIIKIEPHLRVLNINMKTEAFKGTPLDATVMMAYFNDMEIQKITINKYFPFAQLVAALTQDVKLNYMPGWGESFSGNNISGSIGTSLFLTAITYDTYISWTVQHLMKQLQRFYIDPKLGNLLTLLNGGNAAHLYTGMYQKVIEYMANVDFAKIHAVDPNGNIDSALSTILKTYNANGGRLADIVSAAMETQINYRQQQFGSEDSMISIFSPDGMKYADKVQHTFTNEERGLSSALAKTITGMDFGNITAEQLFNQPDVSTLTTMYLSLIIERDVHAKLRQLEKVQCIRVASKVLFNSNTSWSDDIKPIYFASMNGLQENARELYEMQMALAKEDVYDSRFNGGKIKIKNSFINPSATDLELPRLFMADGSNEVDGVVGTGDLLGFDCKRVKEIILRAIRTQKEIMTIPSAFGTTEETAFCFEVPFNLYKQFYKSWKTESQFANLNNVQYIANGMPGQFLDSLQSLMRYNDPNRYVYGSYILTETPAFPINLNGTPNPLDSATNLVNDGIYFVKFTIKSDQFYNIIANPTINGAARTAIMGRGANYTSDNPLQKAANAFQHATYCQSNVYKSLALTSPTPAIVSNFTTKLATHISNGGNPNVLLARLIPNWGDFIFTELNSSPKEEASLDSSGLIGNIKLANGEGSPCMMALKTLPVAKGMVRGDNNQIFGLMICDAVDVHRTSVAPLDIIVEAMADFGETTASFSPADQYIVAETNTGIYASGN